MSPLPTVYAYRDQAEMGPTTWYPRLTYCTTVPDHSDRPGELYVVKFCQGPTGAAAMISEVVCNQLFRAGGINVLNPVIVETSGAFAEGWNNTVARAPSEDGDRGIPTIVAGRYFGTKYVHDVYDGPLSSVDEVENPIHLLLIWVFDCLVCNIDRKNKNNLMLVPHGKLKKLRVIAADHSDCFCGSGPFCSGQWRDLMLTRKRAEGHYVVETVKICGRDAINAALNTVDFALNRIGLAFDNVPQEWWNSSGIDPNDVETILWRRREALPGLMDVEFWNGIADGQIDGEAQIIRI